MGRKEAIIVPIIIFNWITPEPIKPGKNNRKNFLILSLSLGNIILVL